MNSQAVPQRHRKTGRRTGATWRMSEEAKALTCGRGPFSVVPGWLWVSAFAAALGGLLTANPALTAAAFLLVPVGFGLLWRRGEPPALLFAFGIQWLQVTVPVFEANLAGLRLVESLPAPSIEAAAWLSLGGVAAFALGSRAALRGVPLTRVESAERTAVAMSAARLFWVWLLLFAVSAVTAQIMFLVPGITQLLAGLRVLKWLVVFLLAHSVVLKRSSYGWLLATVLVEILYGFTQFFSAFKAVFSILLVVLLTTRSFSGARSAGLAGLAAVLLATSLLWTTIKAEYRDFLSAGEGQQQVVVPVLERFKKLSELLSGVRRNDLGGAAQALTRRIGYLEYFAYSLDCVPAVVPHQMGRLWREALTRPLMPRLFFPDKSPVHDSLRTREYTGINVAGPEEGASIGLGYVAESYIDFGKFWMFLPIFVWGLACGLVYRLLVFGLADKAFGFAAASAILVFGASQVETSNVKLVGGNLVALLLVLACYFSVWPTARRFVLKEKVGAGEISLATRKQHDRRPVRSQPPA